MTNNLYKIYVNNLESTINNYSGNNTTLSRLNRILFNSDTNNFTKTIQNKIIGIHAYKFGLELLKSNNNIFPTDLEYIVIIGGTDINIDINNIKKEPIIKNTLFYAKYIICFNTYLSDRIFIKYKNILDSSKIKLIVQSVGQIDYNIKNNLLEELVYQKTGMKFNKIFIMVGNIRKVKNPLFVKKAFDNTLKLRKYAVALIGDIIDDIEIEWTDNFIHLGPIDNRLIPNIYKQASGLINTSDSEGMSTSILEAMLYKCPVYARDIEGNRVIINNMRNGFLFKYVDEFIGLTFLTTDDVIEKAYNYVTKYHSENYEKSLYQQLF